MTSSFQTSNRLLREFMVNDHWPFWRTFHQSEFYDMNTNGISRERQVPMLCQCSKLWTVHSETLKWQTHKCCFPPLLAFSNAFKISLLQKMHNPADHIFPPQWLVKAFQILIAQLPHDPHLNSSAKGSFCSAAQRNSQPSLLRAPTIGGELQQAG